MNLRIGQGVGAVLVIAGAVGLLLIAALGWRANEVWEAEVQAGKLNVAAAELEALERGLDTWNDLARAALRESEFGVGAVAQEQGSRVQGAIQFLLRPPLPEAMREFVPALDEIQKAVSAGAHALRELHANEASAAGARLLAGRLARESTDVLADTERLHASLKTSAKELRRRADAESNSIRGMERTLEAATALSGLGYLLLILALWRSSVKRIVRPLEALHEGAVRSASTGHAFDLVATGPIEVARITDAVRTLTSRLSERLRDLDDANRRLDRDRQRLIHSNRSLDIVAGARREQLMAFESMTDELQRLQGVADLTESCLVGLCRMLGACGAAAQLRGGESANAEFVHIPVAPGIPVSEQARLRDRLTVGLASSPTAPRATGDSGSDLLDVPVLSSTGKELARLRAVEPRDQETGLDREFDGSDEEACRAVAAIYGAHLERTTLTESIITRMLRMVQLRDPDETHEHAQRVGEIAVRILDRWVAWSEVHASSSATRHEWIHASPIDRQSLRHAAQLHDVGKVGVPDRILTKAGPLSGDEWTLIYGHTTAGAMLFRSGTTTFDRLAEAVTHHHHQRWDGTGYPPVPRDDGTIRPLREEETPLAARIVGIADVLDALLSKRVYKDAWPLDEALEEISKRAGTQFDPELVNCLRAAVSDLRFRASLSAA
ncbi:MAG: HD domain-containing protein [Planctomycetota bacterium]|nr:HD domain-containing protein [Planctomycetota bacterium]